METHSMPATGYLRLNQIIGCKKQHIPAIIPIGRTTWLAGVKSGIYPKPIRLSERTVAWKVEDILSLVSQINASNG